MTDTDPNTNASANADADADADVVPEPVHFNLWKHHAGALRRRIAEVAKGGAQALDALPDQLVVIGTELMDLYLGALSPRAIAEQAVARLGGESVIEPDRYRAWIDEAGGYQTITFDDDTVWVLRASEERGRHVHLHPGRWTPETRRVRANVLKSAVMVLAESRVKGFNPLDLERVNDVRVRRLGLSPMKELAAGEGLAVVIGALMR